MGLKDKCGVRRIFGKLHTLPRQLIGSPQVARNHMVLTFAAQNREQLAWIAQSFT